MAGPPNPSAQALGRIRRELAELDIRTQFTPRGDALTGELLPGDDLVNPLDGQPVPRITFRVGVDGMFQIKSPPLVDGLSVADCVRSESKARLLGQLTQSLHRRVGEVEALHKRLEGLGLDPKMDAERAEVVVQVDLDMAGEAMLVGDDRGLVARYVVPAVGKRTPVSLGDLVLDLADFSDKVDMELFLAARAEEVLAGAGATEASAPNPAAPASAKGLTLEQLVERLGPTTVLGSGFSLVRTFRIDGEEARFEAHHHGDEGFAARLKRGGDTVWEGDLLLSKLSSLDDFVAELVAGNGSSISEVPSPHAWSEEQARLVAGFLPPAPGEIWVMDVHVDDDDGQEVRYHGRNIGGESYGASRVLAKATFEATFAQVGVAYRLLVRVLEVGDDYVEYQRLDAARKPVASPRRAPLIIFMATFIAEAAAY